MTTLIILKEQAPFSLLVNGDPPLPCWRPKWRTGLDRNSFDSVKLGRTVEVVSPWEYMHCMILECDPFVRTYCEYPLEITVKGLDGKNVKSKPDAWVCFTNRVERILEVKSIKQAEQSKRQFDTQRFWCAKALIEHRLVLSETHLSEILVNNCKDIFPFLAKTRRDEVREHVLNIIDRDGGCRLRDLRADEPIVTDRNYTAALQMLCAGILIAPLSEQRFSDLFLERRIGEPDKPLCEGTTEFPLAETEFKETPVYA
jgi:hypothetical protein